MIKILLTLLLIVTLVFDNAVFAEIAKGSGHPLLKSVRGGRPNKSISRRPTCSIFTGRSGPHSVIKGYVKKFLRARGKLILSGKSVEELGDDEEIGLYAGNKNSVPKRKVINLRGTHTGSILRLNGSGKSRGYKFTFDVPREFCVTSKSRSSKLTSSIVDLSFKNLHSVTASIIGKPKVVQSKTGATITGKITTGIGEGRFTIKLSG